MHCTVKVYNNRPAAYKYTLRLLTWNRSQKKTFTDTVVFLVEHSHKCSVSAKLNRLRNCWLFSCQVLMSLEIFSFFGLVCSAVLKEQSLCILLFWLNSNNIVIGTVSSRLLLACLSSNHNVSDIHAADSTSVSLFTAALSILKV